MYTTKPYSLFKSSADAALEAPPRAPGSGFLVLNSAEPEPEATCCWGACEDTRVYELPFPQNRILRVSYTTHQGENTQHYWSDVFFVPVIDQPLGANLYYVVHAKGRNRGKVYTSSTEEDTTTCCFSQCINDIDPQEFDINDIYQQIEIIPHKGKFTARSAAPDGFVPWLLRRKYWKVHASKPKDFILTEALGFNKGLYEQQLELNCPISEVEASKLAIGKWYSTYMFVKEEMSLKDQVKRSAFYEIILEQFWKQVYATKNLYGTEKSVEVRAVVQAETALLNGKEAKRDNLRSGDGTKWFVPLKAESNKVGLSEVLWERLRWEQYRRGWVNEDANINKVEVYTGTNDWKKFACCVLVERFIVKRMDGSLALIIDFKHMNKVQSKWE